MTLDIGCGDSKRGDIGIDVEPWPGVDHLVAAGFEDLPFFADYFDRVYAWDVLEHIPKGVWGGTAMEYPHIRLFQETWRVLKPGGIFDTFTPIAEPGLHGRVFHLSVWNLDTFRQFTLEGSDFRRGHMQRAGFRGEFRITETREENCGLHVLLEAVKT